MFQYGFLVCSFHIMSLTALFVHNPILSVLDPTIDFNNQLLFEYNQVSYKCAGTDIHPCCP